MFKLPIDEYNVPGLLCQIAAESQRTEPLRQSNHLIMWDDLKMTYRFSVEELGITLHNITRDPRHFRGRTTFFSCDWSHIGPPVVLFGDEDDIIKATILSSPLSSHSDRLYLAVPQRYGEDAQCASFRPQS